jgi:hypothetical protein
MDKYTVIAPNGAKVRKDPTVDSDTVATLSKGMTVEVDYTRQIGPFAWCFIPLSGGWVRSDLLERYAHSATPATPGPSTEPNKDYSRGFTEGWNARGNVLADMIEQTRR